MCKAGLVYALAQSLFLAPEDPTLLPASTA